MSDLPNQQERIAGMARNVVAGHRGAFGQPCSECGQLSPCHAWTLANEILHPLHSNPTSSVSTEGVAAELAMALRANEQDVDLAATPWGEQVPEGWRHRDLARRILEAEPRLRLAINLDSPVEPDRG